MGEGSVDSRLELAWADREGRACLRVGGWTRAELGELARLPAAELGRRLAILPSDLVEATADLRALQPVAGRFEISADTICFLPRFPFVDGGGYSLVVDGSPIQTIQRPARVTAAATDVVAIYPSADELPVNQLKLYVHFSRPMSEGWAARAVHVRRADNNEPLANVFLPMEPELWDPERRRLTLLLDPGRIKRGLAPHEEAGYPLIEGVPIIVTVDPTFRDADGQPLRAGAEQRYNVGKPVRARVDPTRWRYECPTAGSKNGLTLAFERPLDHALLGHSLWVVDAAGASVSGEATAGPGEWCWWFEPHSPWKDGRHLLMVDPRLEDLAGNSLIRVFDRDLTRAEDAPADAQPRAIEFACAPRGARGPE